MKLFLPQNLHKKNEKKQEKGEFKPINILSHINQYILYLQLKNGIKDVCRVDDVIERCVLDCFQNREELLLTR
mgnify:CR=1 FL=1